MHVVPGPHRSALRVQCFCEGAQTIGAEYAIELVHAAEELGRAIVVGRKRGTPDLSVTQVAGKTLSAIVDELETRIRSDDWDDA